MSDDGNTALFGSTRADGWLGAAWVFTRSGSTWSQGPKLQGTGVANGAALQGWGVALSGDGNTALLGGPDDGAFPGSYNGTGATWVFTRSGSTWSQEGSKLVGSGTVGNAYQGSSVALSHDGSTALIGGWEDNGYTGAAWVFVTGPPPTIDSFSPGSGITGSEVTITGSNFGDASSVKFGSIEASAFSVVSDTQVRATVPDGAVVGKVSLTTRGGTATSSGEFVPSLSVTGFSPGSGPSGTVVDIKGIGFTPGSTVRFNGTVAASVSFVSSGEVRATVPAAASSGPVTLTNTSAPAGSVRARDAFTVVGIDSISPSSGITGGRVTIAGSGLGGASGVRFGGLPAKFSVVSDTRIDATVPDGAVAGEVSVITPGGTVMSAEEFTPSLSVTGFSPASGPWGTQVDVKGIGFTSGASVRFNGTAAVTVGFVSSGELVALVPPAATSGPVTVRTAAGTVNAAGAYTVTVSGAPRIGLFAPASGITGGQVTISGTYLGGATGVRFGGLQASFAVVSSTEVRATVPDGAIPAKISVTTPTGTAYSPQLFVPTLSVTSVSPHSGPVGTVVAIKGIGFAPGSTVRFGGVASSGVSYISPGEVRVTVPATATSGPVALSNAFGTVRAATGYTVTPSVAPTITSFTPTSGITGSVVRITGTYFDGASVRFGSLRASSSTVQSPTRITAKVPSGAVPGHIWVTTAAGTTTSTQTFTPTLSITAFTPASGPAGTVVDITGVGFTPTSTVKFNGTTATTTYIGPGEVKATVPTGTSTGPIWLTTTTGTVQTRTNYTPTTALTITTPLAV